MAEQKTDVPVPSKALVSNWIEDYRAKTGKTKRAFAAFIGDTPQNYQNVAAGKAYPRFKVLARLAYHGINVLNYIGK